MVSLDFFRHFPTVRNRANEPAPAAQLRVALDKDDMRRSTVLEPPLGQEPPHRLRQGERERDARQRAAGRHAHRPLADRDHVLLIDRARGGRSDAYLVAARDELLSQMRAVAVHAAGHRPVVRRDERDLHDLTRQRKLLIVGSQPIWRGVARKPRHCCRTTCPRPS